MNIKEPDENQKQEEPDQQEAPEKYKPDWKIIFSKPEGKPTFSPILVTLLVVIVIILSYTVYSDIQLGKSKESQVSKISLDLPSNKKGMVKPIAVEATKYLSDSERGTLPKDWYNHIGVTSAPYDYNTIDFKSKQDSIYNADGTKKQATLVVFEGKDKNTKQAVITEVYFSQGEKPIFLGKGVNN